MPKPIAIGADHAGCALKEIVKKHLAENNYNIIDCGVGVGQAADYPDIAVKTSEAIQSGEADYAILLCGTGVGMSMAANKCAGIRACCCSDAYSAKYTRLHNNANMLCVGGRVIGDGMACELVDIFLSTAFEGGRHQMRVDKINALL